MLKIFKKVSFIYHFKQNSNIYQSVAHTPRYTAQYTNVESRNNIYSVLNPYIDFEERLGNKKLHQSLIQRNIEIDLENIIQSWKQYKKIEETKLKLERSRGEIAKKIKAFSDTIGHEKDIEGLKMKGKLMRQDLKYLENIFTDFEQILLPKLTRLPNDIENDMYKKDIELFLMPNSKTDHHLDIARKLGLIEYISPFAYFLKNGAVEFELQVVSSFFNFFSKHGFIPLSNPDFSRNILIEGCSLSPDSLFTLQHYGNDNYDQFYLNGSASLMPFCSFHAKHICENVPVRYVSQGRHYEPINFDQRDGLYSVCQNSSVQVFIGSSSATSSEEFNNTVSLILELYRQFNLHFRVVKVHPSQLELSEALKLSFQVHSPSRDQYFEVGNLSFYGEYISKKLRMYYRDKDNKKFLSIISGTILKIPPLLGAYIESKKDCKIPETILAHS